MAALGEEIHARGLKFGLYASPGRKTCAKIYDRYPSDHLGSLRHELGGTPTGADLQDHAYKSGSTVSGKACPTS